MKKIYETLKENQAIGEDNAMTMQEIMEVLEVHNARRISEMVNTERKDQQNPVIICSVLHGAGGYYIPATDEEIARFVYQQKSRIKEHAETIRAAQLYLKNNPKLYRSLFEDEETAE